MKKLVTKLILSAYLFSGLGTQQAITQETSTNHNHFIHQVEEKDTLFSLAKKFGLASYQQIVDINPGLDADHINIGQEIKVPSFGLEKVTESASKTAKDCYLVHTVKTGDTLYAISRNYGLSLDGLLGLNPYMRHNPHKLSIGQKLIVQTPDPCYDTVEPAPQVEENAILQLADRYHYTSGRHVGGKRDTSTLDKIVVHTTNSYGMSAENWFHDPNPPKGQAVSAHYIIEQDGTIVGIVPLDQIANHCKGENQKSIGIEVVGKSNGLKITYTQEQFDSLKTIIPTLQQIYNITDKAIYGHSQLDSKKPFCPGVGNLIELKKRLASVAPN